ncbi:M15 family metallopeptidase [Streptomyces globosus]|uniref:M15 family metallopeptidase n=1 Tax=Streptomyces globosus TaxID=68209 RepID=UPI0038059DD8
MRPIPMAVTAALAFGAVLAASAPPAATPALPPVRAARAAAPSLAAEVMPVPAEALGATYREGCPVGPERLRLIRMNHWGFDGKVHRGALVVHEAAVGPLLGAFGKVFAARFPIRRMQPASAYGGDDGRSMADDNTSAFNCRPVTGDPGRRSQHAYGDAVDINPVENPYVDRSGTVHPAAGRANLRRDRSVPGMIRPGDAVSRAFGEIGWAWGGRWPNPDYQHFSATGG